jgi:hypothetical protein
VRHDGSRPAAAVAHDTRTCCRSPQRYVPTAVGYGGMSVARYGPMSGRGPRPLPPCRTTVCPCRRGPHRQMYNLQNFWRTIYFYIIVRKYIKNPYTHASAVGFAASMLGRKPARSPTQARIGKPFFVGQQTGPNQRRRKPAEKTEREKRDRKERVLLAAGTPPSSHPRCHRIARHSHRHKSSMEQILPKLPSCLAPLCHGRLFSLPQPNVRNRMLVSLKGGGGELGNLKP